MAKFVVCNWKENPRTMREALALARSSDAPHVAIAPPFPFLGAVRSIVRSAALGAQDVFYEDGGAFTGAVSASQLASVGVTYVLVGHSERRRLGDTDDIVAKKLRAAMRARITPILCIGETREERSARQSETIIRRQLEKGLSLVASGYTLNPIIAYEPVWAISTESGAAPDTPENATRMIQLLKKLVVRDYALNPIFIYGGSVNVENAEGFLKQAEIEGALVGSASLKEGDIKKIIEIAKQY